MTLQFSLSSLSKSVRYPELGFGLLQLNSEYGLRRSDPFHFEKPLADYKYLFFLFFNSIKLFTTDS